MDMPGEKLGILKKLLTFEELPTQDEIVSRALKIACLALTESLHEGEEWQRAMIGGAPFLMSTLEAVLHDVRIRAVYAFSKRESVEQIQTDGSTRKVAIFRHLGFTSSIMSEPGVSFPKLPEATKPRSSGASTLQS